MNRDEYIEHLRERVSHLEKENARLQNELILKGIKWKDKEFEQIRSIPSASDCLWRNMNPLKPAGLSCPCPRCTPYGMNYGDHATAVATNHIETAKNSGEDILKTLKEAMDKIGGHVLSPTADSRIPYNEKSFFPLAFLGTMTYPMDSDNSTTD